MHTGTPYPGRRFELLGRLCVVFNMPAIHELKKACRCVPCTRTARGKTRLYAVQTKHRAAKTYEQRIPCRQTGAKSASQPAIYKRAGLL
jgi:hypothetical protein